MKKKKPGAWRDKINGSRRVHRPGGGKVSTRKEVLPGTETETPVVRRAAPRATARPAAGTEAAPLFDIIERTPEPASASTGPFRVLIAVHRPRFRGRAERAAALVGWEVTALLNKQDPVGMVQKPPRPPDLLILSQDFGRQRDMAIFRAVQKWRAQGMKLIGLVEDCTAAPEGHPDSLPTQICDVCLEPPYKMVDLRNLFARLYEEMRGEHAPPPKTAANTADEEDPDED